MNLTITKTTIALFLAVATANFASAQDSSLRGDIVVSPANEASSDSSGTRRQLYLYDSNFNSLFYLYDSNIHTFDEQNCRQDFSDCRKECEFYNASLLMLDHHDDYELHKEDKIMELLQECMKKCECLAKDQQEEYAQLKNEFNALMLENASLMRLIVRLKESRKDD